MGWKSVKVKEEDYKTLRGIDPSVSKAIGILLRGKPAPTNDLVRKATELEKRLTKIEDWLHNMSNGQF